MTNRRSLVEGLKSTPSVENKDLEKAFVFGETAKVETPIVESRSRPSQASKSPLSTRIRSDFAAALKRASLERQLDSIEPHTLQDILEQAIEPWLKSNGYLP